MHEGHIPMYVRSAQRMRSPRRYVVTYALRRNLILVLPLRPSNSFSCSLSLTRQNFPLMSNSRLDDFHFVRALFSFFVFSLLHTRLLHLCHCGRRSFWISTYPRRGGKKKAGEKGEVHTYRFLVTAQTWYRCSYEKRTLAKKRACALACLPACN